MARRPVFVTTPNCSFPLTFPLHSSPASRAQSFLLSPSLSITAYHAIHNAKSVTLASRPVIPHVIRPSIDLALLRIPDAIHNIPVPKFVTPVSGKVYRIAAPSPRETESFVRLLGLRVVVCLAGGGRVRMLVLDRVGGGVVGKGWSGGAVVEKGGGVIGVVVQVCNDEIHAVEATYVKEMMGGSVRPVGYLVGVEWEGMSARVRKRTGVGREISGVHILRGGRDGLKEGDIVGSVDGRRVGNEGMVTVGELSVEWRGVNDRVGEWVSCRVWRSGSWRGVRERVRDGLDGCRAAGWVDRVVSCGTVVFGRLCFEYLSMFGADWRECAPRDLVQMALEESGEEVVICVGFTTGTGETGLETLRHLRAVKVQGQLVRELGDLVGGQVKEVEFANGRIALVDPGVWQDIDGFFTTD